MDWWEEDYDEMGCNNYIELICEGCEFHYYAELIEQCEREEQIKKMFNKLINEDVEHISNYIFSFI
jgi:hypothetical protein